MQFHLVFKEDLQIPRNLGTTRPKRLFPRSPNNLWKATCPLCPRYRHSPADLSAPHALCAMGAGCIRATPAKRYFICIQGIDMHCTSLPSSRLPKTVIKNRRLDWHGLPVGGVCCVSLREDSLVRNLAKTSKLPRYELQVDPPQVEVPSTPKAEFGPEVRRKIEWNWQSKQFRYFHSGHCAAAPVFLCFLKFPLFFWGSTASIPELKESLQKIKRIDGQCNGDAEATEPANISISHSRWA